MRRRDASFLAGFFLLGTALVVYGFASRAWLPPVASEHGHGVDRMIRYLLLTTGVLFVLGHLALGWLVWRGARADSPAYRPIPRRTEWTLALAPVLLMAIVSEGGVLAIGLPVWAKVYGESPRDALQVEVVGKQFEWLVRYPGADGKFGRTIPGEVHEVDNPVGLDEGDADAEDDLISRGVLHLPVGRPVVVRLRSHDVLHSFSVSQFRIKQDVIPGVTLTARFLPEKAGTYEIACAELCGLGHYRMRGTVVVHPPEEFERWLAAQEGWFK